MDDPQEIKIVSTPEELLKLEQSDLCVTLYTIWDTLRDRGDIAGRHFFSCRNNSSVPDESFWMLVQKELSDCESVVDRGELFVLAPMAFAELRDSVAARLHTALESL